MPRIVFLIIPLWLAGLLWGSMAHGVEFIATVDKTRGSIEDVFRLTLSIKNVGNVRRPEFPSSEEFQVQYQGQSSQTRWINGETSSQVDFQYNLIPLETGRLTIPVVTINIEGREYRTEPIHLNISEVSETPIEQKPAFVKHFLSHPRAYPGQQLHYTFELYVRQGLQIRNLNFSRPEFSAFQVKDSVQKESVIKNIEGMLFEIYTLQLILFPQKTGKITILPASLQGRLPAGKSQGGAVFKSLHDSFFGGELQSFQLRTKPLTLEVLPIPPENQPGGFYGLVGKFNLQANLSQSEIKVGESATLTITISGTGLPETIRKPDLILEESLKIYEDQPLFQSELEGDRQIGKAIFAMAIVPSEPGTITFPPVSISFFNPETRLFETAEVEISPISVIPGEEQELNAAGGTQQSRKHIVKRLGDDLLPIHQDIAALQNSIWETGGLIFYGCLFLLGPLGFAGGWLCKWKIEHSAANHHKIRSQQAFSTFQKTTRQLYEICLPTRYLPNP